MVKALVSCVIMGSALTLAICIGELIMELAENLFPGIGLPAEEDIEGIDDADI